MLWSSDSSGLKGFWSISLLFPRPDRTVQHVLRGHPEAAEQSGNQSLQRGRLRQQQERREPQEEATEQEQVSPDRSSASKAHPLRAVTASVCVFRPMEISAKRPAPFLRQVVGVRKPVSGGNCRSHRVRSAEHQMIVCFFRHFEIPGSTTSLENTNLRSLRRRINSSTTSNTGRKRWESRCWRSYCDGRCLKPGLRLKLVCLQMVQKQLKKTKNSAEKKEKLQFLLKRMVCTRT